MKLYHTLLFIKLYLLTGYTTSYLQNNYDYTVFYSKGHRGWSNDNSHISLLDHTGNGFYDYDIASRTSYSKNTFTFIWHCETALYYNPGGTNTDGLGRAIGMPYAFTHNNNLPIYGTTGHQVYLGWKNKNDLQVHNFTTNSYNIVFNAKNGTTVGSPQYEWGINPNYNYAQVARFFWEYMSQGYTTEDALNILSNTIYGTAFINSGLQDWLIIYGNRLLTLPAYSPYPHVSSIAGYTTYGHGSVNNPNGLIGSAPDGSYVQLYGGDYGDGGHIVGQLNTAASGNIWVYAYSGNGYYTHFYTFVSYNNNYDWTQTKVQTVVGNGGGGQWINCGSYNGNFRYVGLAGYDDNGMSASIYIDAVQIRP